MRFFRAVLTLCVCALLCGCKSTTASATTGSTIQLQWHLASEKKLPGYVDMTELEIVKGGGKLWVAPEPILRLQDISNAARSSSGDNFLYLTVKVSSRSGLQSDTGSHLRDLLAVMFKGKIVYVAILQSPLSRQVIVRIGENGISETQVNEIIQAIRDGGGEK
ncbi:MAG: hypothetical protein EXS12_02365 [Phycisphaerales bacterium]|nr:hypothetical protein [Phycisphaerales bacterium]